MAMKDLKARLTVWEPKLVKQLGNDASRFTTTLLNICTNNKQLEKCEANSIIGAAMLATTLKLSISPSLGQAYVVPYGDKAQLQVGVRGYIQLALRTGQYTRIHAGKVYEGEFRGFNPMTGEPILGEKISDEVAGYVAYFRMVNGFEKTLYMSKAEIEAHAEKYSRAYAYDKRSGKETSQWSSNFDDMATKTVLKKLLRMWGVLSTDFNTAMQADQSVVDKDSFTYVDNLGGVQAREDVQTVTMEAIEGAETINTETGEVAEISLVESPTKSDTEKKDVVPF